jgi:uncharacterized protein
MPRRIDEDHKEFHDVYAGKKRKELKKYIKNGSIFKNRGKDGKIILTIPKIDIPHIVYGDNGEGGIGRGEGEKGEVIGKDDDKGQKRKAGDGEGEGIDIAIDLEEVLKFLKDELQLPDMKPKPNNTYEEVVKKYNNISLVGPESLRHNNRTLKQALKRQCADNSINKLHTIPGFKNPIKLIVPINSDKRYRQYNEVQVPSSNAVIFFARDGSASMDQYKCDIVSDMCWWIDVWIRRFYKKVDRMYLWHDTVAKEVDENKFYKYRYGGGTKCSSVLRLASKIIENRYHPSKWNIYFFYFTDGENWGGDNELFNNIIQNEFNSNVANMFGITQVLPWSYQNSLKEYMDDNNNNNNLKSVQINYTSSNFQISEEERDSQIKDAIIGLLGKKNEK